MARLLIRLTLCGVAGLVAATLIAWVCVIRAASHGHQQQEVSRQGYELPSPQMQAAWLREYGPSVFVTERDQAASMEPASIPTTQQFGSMVFMIWETRMEQFGCSHAYGHDMMRQMPVGLATVRAGWPVACFEARRKAVGNGVTQAVSGGVLVNLPDMLVTGPRIGPRTGTQCILPLEPIWPGLLFNSIIFGGLLAGAQCVCAGARRTWRTRHGRCPTCAYPRGDSPVCTECGDSFGETQS